jgi:hypothetical protein
VAPASSRSRAREIEDSAKAKNRQSTVLHKGKIQDDINYNVFVQEIEMEVTKSHSINSARSEARKEEGQN